MARRIRQKLMEVEIDEHWLAHVQTVMDECSPVGFRLKRDSEYLRWRYKNVPGHNYRWPCCGAKPATASTPLRSPRPSSRTPDSLGCADHFTSIPSALA